ncbi:transcriptional regulator : [Gemmata massiliana]|uniref:Transcriptional regulator n=1 Tax=Gemmata massiliana TaxID=1210884 RepID=A0A6P2CVB5_9BACT|nr:helix-turn-helix domain-containing protein [Gemmata massiliana]VTR92921.1 transcriptional regulator : [Gemmata massiliana]
MRGERAARNGKAFRLTGKVLAVFTALLHAGDSGLTLLELKRVVWDEHVDDRTAQNAVSRLRHLARDGLGMSEAEDPVEADRERYRLAAA